MHTDTYFKLLDLFADTRSRVRQIALIMSKEHENKHEKKEELRRQIDIIIDESEEKEKAILKEANRAR